MQLCMYTCTRMLVGLEKWGSKVNMINECNWSNCMSVISIYEQWWYYRNSLALKFQVLYTCWQAKKPVSHVSPYSVSLTLKDL